MSDLGKFISRIVIFMTTAFVVIGLYFYVFMSNIPVSERIGAGVYHVLDKSKKANLQTQRLVLGDSVCAQMYPSDKYNDEINSLASNQAITPVGCYSILRSFLDHFEGDRNHFEVHFVYRPSSFRNNLDQRYTFNYFLKPFNNPEYVEDFSPSVHRAIQEIPFGWLSKYDFIKQSNWAPRLRASNNIHDFRMAPIAAEYLLKMESICKQQGIDFYVHSSFMSNEFSISDFEMFKTQIKDCKVTHLFEDYFAQIRWLDAKHFYDGAHLKSDVKKSILGHNFLDF